MATAAASAPALVWFNRDLRLADNPALHAAVKSGRPLLLVYIRDHDPLLRLSPGAASEWWLRHALAALQSAVRARGSELHLLSGDTASILQLICKRLNIREVYWNQTAMPWIDQRDRNIGHALLRKGIQPRVFRSTVLLDPEVIRTKSGSPFKVFSAFWRVAVQAYTCAHPHPAPSRIQGSPGLPGDRLDDWAFLPQAPDWSRKFATFWQPGEEAAQVRLTEFIATALGNYKTERDRPDIDGTSRLSPHLAFGEISPRQVWHALDVALENGHPESAVEKYRAEIGWREFAYYLFHHFGDLRSDSFNPAFDKFPWVSDSAALDRWQRGLTGIPMVDAGMRQLWATGWMHNRVRMITASYLVKHLGIHWSEGMRWFEDTLVDADPLVNAASWQWVAGSGADAAPYFRIFNPVTQGQKFDPDGDYVRRWVDELASVPAPRIHEPETVAGYPSPVIGLKEGREKALAAYAGMRPQEP